MEKFFFFLWKRGKVPIIMFKVSFSRRNTNPQTIGLMDHCHICMLGQCDKQNRVDLNGIFVLRLVRIIDLNGI